MTVILISLPQIASRAEEEERLAALEEEARLARSAAQGRAGAAAALEREKIDKIVEEVSGNLLSNQTELEA